MRLPLRHPPLCYDARTQRCAHLENLASYATGVPLGPAAQILLANAGRGRHGNALQWHLGLAARDSCATLDWENRIEIKLVSIWSRSDGQVTCDKLKVCDVNVDPWHKLSNVLWIYADRMTRVVLGCRFSSLRGDSRLRLESSWDGDPHFSKPDLFVEARESSAAISPAYYLSAAWLIEEGLRYAVAPLMFDPGVWSKHRAAQSHPRWVVVANDAQSSPCPHCGGALQWDCNDVAQQGWALATHVAFRGFACDQHETFVVASDRIPLSKICSADEQQRALAGLLRYEQLWRLADRVPEPDDHMH